MGMILGHHIPPPLGPAPAVDTCSLSTKFDGGSPHPTNLIFRYDVRAKPDGTRFWTRHGGSNHPAFDNIFQYDAPAPWQLSGWVLSASQSITTDTFVRTIDWHDEGRKLTMLNRWFSSFRRLDTFDQSATPWDITVLGPVFASRTGIPGGEFLVRWNLEASAGGASSGTHVFVSRSAYFLDKFVCTKPHDISTMNLTPVQTFDFLPFGFRTDLMTFSADHTKIYGQVQTTDGFRVGSFDLTAPDDISAPFNFTTGPLITTPPEPVLGVARGWNVRPDTGDVITFGDQNNFRVRCWAGGTAPSTDPAFSSVVLLLDMAGPDGGTNITDLSNSSHNETFNGDAQIDVSVRAKGQNTLIFDGIGDSIDYPQSSDFDFPGDFTVEASVRWDGTATGGLVSTYDVPTTNGGWWLQFASPNLLRWGQADFPVHIQRTFAPVIGQVYDIAITRDGTDLRMFIDGVQQGATETNSTNYSGSTRGVCIGALQPPTVQDFDGNIGAVRITKGVARYTSGYTPGGCFFPSDPVPPSPVVASGAPSITKPTSAGAAVHTPAPLAIVGGAPLIGSGGAPQLIPPAAVENVGDRIFVYGANEVPAVDGTWTQLATAPASFHLFTKIAAGDATDDANTQGTGVAHAVFIKFTMVDPGGVGVWDFDAQSSLRNTFRTAFDNNSLGFGLGSGPSCAFFAGLRIGSGTQPGTVGDFSDPNFNAPPNGGTILKVKTQDANPPNNTYWHGISFFCEPTKVTYATGKKWTGANEPTSHLTQTRGFRYDHD